MACPHTVTGPIIMGSPNVFINALPAARKTDMGIATACCGPNTYEIKVGSATVFINGKAAARKDDMTMHCNTGTGKVITGSPTVNIE
jgi:uncharacterized Zn-binding protein involved in type VI secretion